MARRSREIVCTEDEIRELRRRVSAHTSTQREPLRAKIILRCHDGETDKGICMALKGNHLTVSGWRKRFAIHRLAGLEDFQAFLEDIIRDVPSQNEIHIILDNYSTHKKNEVRLVVHPHVKFRFTPTSASWLNQVEIWFGIFLRKVLKGASFDSKDFLAQATRDFADAYQKNARPFVWKKRDVKGL